MVFNSLVSARLTTSKLIAPDPTHSSVDLDQHGSCCGGIILRSIPAEISKRATVSLTR